MNAPDPATRVSETPSSESNLPLALPGAAAGSASPAPSTAPSVSCLGTVDILTDNEMIQLLECESIIRSGWESFVRVGLALVRIRDGRLYRNDFGTFEVYCQAKWRYGRRYVNLLISASQLTALLGTDRSQSVPENEWQVRPLIGLTPEQALLAWECAVRIARSGRVTAGVVRRAIKELGFAPPAATDHSQPRPSKAARRRMITDGFGELLTLLRQESPRELLVEKAEALHGQLMALW